jgi:hypothetical protein
VRSGPGLVRDQSQDTHTDESVKWTGENVLPSRPQAVLLVEIKAKSGVRCHTFTPSVSKCKMF